MQLLQMLHFKRAAQVACQYSISLLFMTWVGPEGQSRCLFCDFIFTSSYLLIDPKVFRGPPDGP